MLIPKNNDSFGAAIRIQCVHLHRIYFFNDSISLQLSGGVRSSVFGNGMTRGPVVRFPSALLAR